MSNESRGSQKEWKTTTTPDNATITKPLRAIFLFFFFFVFFFLYFSNWISQTFLFSFSFYLRFFFGSKISLEFRHFHGTSVNLYQKAIRNKQMIEHCKRARLRIQFEKLDCVFVSTKILYKFHTNNCNENKIEIWDERSYINRHDFKLPHYQYRAVHVHWMQVCECIQKSPIRTHNEKWNWGDLHASVIKIQHENEKRNKKKM